jgi:hypothetical protein
MDPILQQVLISVIAAIVTVVGHKYATAPASPPAATPTPASPAAPAPATHSDPFAALPGLPGHPILNGLRGQLPLLLQLLQSAAAAPNTAATATATSSHDQAAIALLAPLVKQSPEFLAAINAK